MKNDVAPTRDTRQKRAIRRALERAERPLSIDEILAAAERESAGLGVATVYRAVRALVDAGFLSAVELPGRPALYEVAGKGHHHHFVCDGCGAVHELDVCPSPSPLPLPRGFRARAHDVTIYGRCPRCARGENARSRPLRSR